MSNFFVPRDSLEKADVIAVLTGNGLERTNFAVKLYRDGWAPVLLMIGSTGSQPPSKMAEQAKKLGVPAQNIITENQSANTRQNAENCLSLARQKNWQKIILVTSPHHQKRAQLTFEKVRKELNNAVKIISYPPLEYSWLDLMESSRDQNKKVLRFFYLFSELWKIIKYRIKGDL